MDKVQESKPARPFGAYQSGSQTTVFTMFIRNSEHVASELLFIRA